MDGGGDDDDCTTLQLLPFPNTPSHTPLPKEDPLPLPLTHIQNPEMDDGENRLELLPLFNPPPHSAENQPTNTKPPLQNENPHPPKPKPKKYKPQTQKKPETLSQKEKISLIEKARTYKWRKWSPKVTPSVASLPCEPHLLCAMHEELLKSGVSPVDDLYNHLPTTITARKRFNVKGEAAYLIFGKRYQGNTLAKANRKFRTKDIMARWRNKGTWNIVAGKNGQVVGMHFFFVLEYMGKEVASGWTADEYISVTSEAGASSIVILRCKDEQWNSVEVELQKAEDQLLGNYQRLLSARLEGLTTEIRNLEAVVFNSEVELGFALTEFENTRDAFKFAQDLSVTVEGKVIADVGLEGVSDESVNLELTMAVGAGGCSVGADLTYGEYFKALYKRKMEDNSRKLSSRDKTASEDVPDIVVGTASDPIPSVLIPSGISYFARHVEETSQQRNSEGKEETQK